MFIAPECRETMALEQAEFQSMVSGEDVSVAIKHEKAKSIQWTTPGVMAGTRCPDGETPAVRFFAAWSRSTSFDK